MKSLQLVCLAAGMIGILSGFQKPAETVVVIGGDTDGYLSPCGCTKPMSGGIRRRMSMIKTLTSGKNALVLENGGLVKDDARHDQIKAETLVQALAASKVDAINLGPSEAKLGVGGVLSLVNLAGDRFIASTLVPSERLSFQRFVEKGPFVVAGITLTDRDFADSLGERSAGIEATLKDLVELAESTSKMAAVMVRGSLDDAKRLPYLDKIRLVVYRSSGAPAAQPVKIGQTIFASPGEKGKFVLRLGFQGNKFTSYQAISLFPDVKDDPVAARLYRSYLQRVRTENLLSIMPRTPSDPFAGNAACGTCHTEAMKVWKSSEHGHALKTLKDDGHDRDPDCVGCHVVGLDKIGGFSDEKSTPQLANVGCESCHGPGAKHAKQPIQFKMPKVGAKACMKCHVPDHSPGFTFEKYWPAIKH